MDLTLGEILDIILSLCMVLAMISSVMVMIAIAGMNYCEKLKDENKKKKQEEEDSNKYYIKPWIKSPDEEELYEKDHPYIVQIVFDFVNYGPQTMILNDFFMKRLDNQRSFKDKTNIGESQYPIIVKKESVERIKMIMDYSSFPKTTLITGFGIEIWFEGLKGKKYKVDTAELMTIKESLKSLESDFALLKKKIEKNDSSSE